MPNYSDERALFGIPGLDCIDDFLKYLSDADLREAVQTRFLDQTVPLLDRGCEIFVLAHSWGSVVAYDSLCQIDPTPDKGRVGRLFTIGSPLSMGWIARWVKKQPHAVKLDGRRPPIARGWTNLDARGDIVGGVLGEFRGVEERVGLTPTSCGTSMFGLVGPACAHSSYFDPANEVVARDIFARAIER